MAPMTTLGIGGPARYFADSASVDHLVAGVKWARGRGLPLFVLGGGSNVVISDAGFAGLVLRLSIRGMEAAPRGDHIILKAGAGEEWDPLVGLAVENELGGVRMSVRHTGARRRNSYSKRRRVRPGDERDASSQSKPSTFARSTS